ncbi:hypothetical protein B0H19DRAFT_482917 [Mycena capillaripes]|nr:hypothetical protein B0H19DRAFT_482917 [Mycena capillaripes]
MSHTSYYQQSGLPTTPCIIAVIFVAPKLAAACKRKLSLSLRTKTKEVVIYLLCFNKDHAEEEAFCTSWTTSVRSPPPFRTRARPVFPAHRPTTPLDALLPLTHCSPWPPSSYFFPSAMLTSTTPLLALPLRRPPLPRSFCSLLYLIPSPPHSMMTLSFTLRHASTHPRPALFPPCLALLLRSLPALPSSPSSCAPPFLFPSPPLSTFSSAFLISPLAFLITVPALALASPTTLTSPLTSARRFSASARTLLPASPFSHPLACSYAHVTQLTLPQTVFTIPSDTAHKSPRTAATDASAI